MNQMSAQAPTTIEFNKAFDHAEFVMFSPKWHNGTGYMNGAVSGEHAADVEVGHIACSKTLEAQPRKLIIIGTPVGNVVVFQRYGNRDDVYAINSTLEFNSMFGPVLGRPLTADNISFLVGDPSSSGMYPNIGEHIVKMVHLINTFDPENANVG